MVPRFLLLCAAASIAAFHDPAPAVSPVTVEQVGARPAPARAGVRINTPAPGQSASRTAGTALEQESTAIGPNTPFAAPLPEICARAAQAGAPPPPGCLTAQSRAAPQASAGEDLLLSLFGGGIATPSTGTADTAPTTDANADAVARELGTDGAGAGAGSEAGAIGARQRPAPSTPPPNPR